MKDTWVDMGGVITSGALEENAVGYIAVIMLISLKRVAITCAIGICLGEAAFLLNK